MIVLRNTVATVVTWRPVKAGNWGQIVKMQKNIYSVESTQKSERFCGRP